MPPVVFAPVDKPPIRWRWLCLPSPQLFYPLAGRLLPWLWMLAAVLAAAGLGAGLLVAPTDGQRSDLDRIAFIHLPAACLSVLIYLAVAFWAGLGLALDVRLPSMLASALAPTGALMSLVTLWTGALWGKPGWGSWWVWDLRLTSELLLLFLYLGLLALQAAIDDQRRADRACALLALVGMVNLPVIYCSVRWWNTLHQGASISPPRVPDMASVVLAGMVLMTCALALYAAAVALHRLRSIILERERDADWVAGLQETHG